MELKQDLLLQQPTQLVQEPNPVVYGGAQVRSSCKMHAPRARREGNPPVVLMLSLLLTDACSDARVRGRWGSCVQVVEEPQQQIYMVQPQQPQQLYMAQPQQPQQLYVQAQQPLVPPPQQAYAAQQPVQMYVVQPLHYVAQTVQQGSFPEGTPPRACAVCCLISLVALLALLFMPSDQDISVPSLQNSTSSTVDSVFAAINQQCCSDSTCPSCGFDLPVEIDPSNYFEHEATLLIRATHTDSGIILDDTYKMFEGRWEGVVQSRPALWFSSPFLIDVAMQQPDSTSPVAFPWSCGDSCGTDAHLSSLLHESCADHGQFKVTLEGWLNYTSPWMRNQRFEDQTYTILCRSASSASWPHSAAPLPMLAAVASMTFMMSS